MVLRPRRSPTRGIRSRNNRIRDWNPIRGVVAGSGVFATQEIRDCSFYPRWITDISAAIQTKNNEQIQKILEIVPSFCRIRMRGDGSGERVPRIRGDGGEWIVREIGVLLRAFDAGRGLCSIGGEFMGGFLQKIAGGEDEKRGTDRSFREGKWKLQLEEEDEDEGDDRATVNFF